MSSDVAKEAVEKLKAEIAKKKLPPLIDRKFVQLCDEEGEVIRIMQWNMLAFGKVIILCS